MASLLPLGIGMKSLDPLSDPTLVQLFLLVHDNAGASCGESMQAVPGGWRNWYHWMLTWPKSNRTPLGHYVSVHLMPPGCISDCPGAQWCPGPDLGGNECLLVFFFCLSVLVVFELTKKFQTTTFFILYYIIYIVINSIIYYALTLVLKFNHSTVNKLYNLYLIYWTYTSL